MEPNLIALQSMAHILRTAKLLLGMTVNLVNERGLDQVDASTPFEETQKALRTTIEAIVDMSEGLPHADLYAQEAHRCVTEAAEYVGEYGTEGHDAYVECKHGHYEISSGSYYENWYKYEDAKNAERALAREWLIEDQYRWLMED